MRFERRVFWAVAAVLTLAILTVPGCNQSPDAKEARYLEKGRKEFQKRNYAVAILHFKNAS
jgi:hypothetical protein